MHKLLFLTLACSSDAFASDTLRHVKKSPRPAFVGALKRTSSVSMMGPLASSAAIFGAANGLGFGISLATGWHYHLDLIGTGVFAVAAFAVAGQAPAQRASAFAVAAWASKLAGFLFYRALQTKYDGRLTDMLASSTGAFGFWLVSFAWGWFVSLPHTLAASRAAASQAVSARRRVPPGRSKDKTPRASTVHSTSRWSSAAGKGTASRTSTTRCFVFTRG